MKISNIESKDIKRLGCKTDDGVRQLRKPLLEVFDIYKSNIAYGVESETEEERAEILSWYQRLLDKDKSALETIPDKIKRYL